MTDSMVGTCTICGNPGYWEVQDLKIFGPHGGSQLCTRCRDSVFEALIKMAIKAKKKYDRQKDGEDILGQIDFDKDE
jgi:hypothetical protein